MGEKGNPSYIVVRSLTTLLPTARQRENIPNEVGPAKGFSKLFALIGFLFLLLKIKCESR